jgi:catechol 2,3-dioxygenase-like lactoylglutathione lyase family enzyme
VLVVRQHSQPSKARDPAGLDPPPGGVVSRPVRGTILIMAYHHVALATRDLAATHRFYTEAMGFTLVKAVVGPTDAPGGWAKHVFYDTGGDGLIAFWDLHDERFTSFDPRISEGLGLPTWVNHIAFNATDEAVLEAQREHWLDMGIDVVEIDHGFCRSIYTNDPNGILVEWCTDTRALNDEDRAAALRAVESDEPELEQMPEPQFHQGRKPAVTGAG